MNAIARKENLVSYWNTRCVEMLQERNNLSRDDLEYLMGKAAALRDERMKSCIATLVGWGDEERAEFETFVAIALELMAMARPSQINEAARRVEIRALIKATT
jgi:hypothetical protein